MKPLQTAVGLSFLLLLPARAPGQQAKAEPATPVKIALVSNEKGDILRNVLTLAEAKLSKVPGLQVLERETINRVLSEQKLSLSGLVATDQVLTVGKLLAVDLFAVLEAGLDKKEVAGLVVFDAGTGVRLWDAALRPGSLDEVVAVTVAAIQKAHQKRRAIDTLRAVCLLTVRNADLPRDLDGFCDSVGLLLERHLIASPDLALLERRRLEQVNKERNLPVDSPLRKLLASVVTIELEIGFSPEGKGLKCTALLSDGRGKSIGKSTAVVATRDAAALALAVFKETAQALNAKAAPAEGGRVQEAGRFLREAEFFWDHKDPQRALPAAESAFALHPDAPSVRVALARGLLASGNEVLDPGDRRGVGSFVHKVDPKTLELSVELARRGSERLLDSEASATDGKLTPSGNVHKMLAENQLFYYLQKVGGVTEGVTPASREGIEAIQAIRFRIQEIRFNRTLAGLKDKASFDKFSEQTNNALMSVLDPSIPSSEWIASLRRLRLWADAARKFEDVRASSSRSLLSRALFSYRYPRGKLTAAELAQLQTFWAELEKHPNLTIAVYARLGSMANGLAFSNPSNEDRLRKVRAYRLFVQEQLTKGAKEPPVLRLNLYLAAADGIDQLINLPGYGEEKKELCEFMLARKELAPTVVQMTAFTFLAHRKLQDQRYAYDLLERGLTLLDGGEGRFLTYAETPAVLQFDRDRFRKEFLRMQSQIREAAPSIGPPPTIAWKKLDTLIDVKANKDGIVWIQRPVVHEGVVYTAVIRYEGTPPKHYVQLLKLSLDEGGKWEGRKVEISLPFKPWAGTKENPSRLNVNFGTAACVYQDRYYLGTNAHGIFAFPFNDGLPERITTTEGLPSDHVQALACLGDRLFAYLGEANKDSYIVAWDLKANKCEVLASSRRKDNRSPFDDNTPLLTTTMLPDPVRDQIVFPVFSPFSQHPLNGVWALNVKKDSFSRLFILHHTDIALAGPNMRIDGDKLLMASTVGPFTFDLVKKDKRLLYDNKVSLEVGPLRSALFSLGRMPEYHQRTENRLDARHPYLLADGWLWAAAPFSRKSIDGTKQEQLAGLRSDQRWFQPTECLQLFHGERQLLAGDSFGLWVLTLPDGK
jgi:hypothetical protein